MNGQPPSSDLSLWPLGLHALLVLLIVAGVLVVSALLGERHLERATTTPYESGIVPTGSARTRLDAHFYPVAIAFVIFDLELAFLFAWAVAAVDLGWTGFVEIVVFVVVLLVALIYLWRERVFAWGRPLIPPQRTPQRASAPGATREAQQ